MDPTQSAEIALRNLTSIPVLAFILGVLAISLLRADLRLPDPVYRGISFYLLLAIGLKGGVALRESTFADVVGPALVAVLLGLLIPLAAFHLLRFATRLGVVDRGALAAHYGSTSLVTFTAALALVDALGLPREGHVATLVVILEIPGIIVGLALAQRARRAAPQAARVAVGTGGAPIDEVPRDAPPDTTTGRPVVGPSALREILTGPSVLLMAGGLAIGAIAGPAAYEPVSPLFSGLFTGVLALFLLHLGVSAGLRLPSLRTAGIGLLAFAVVFPLLAGSAGVLAGAAVGMSTGGAALLGVLCGSASYIAAPAAISLALPQADGGLCLTSSLGVTFPFNLVIGVPLLITLAQMVVPA